MNKIGIDDLDVKNKKVFLRVDFNVPLNDNQAIVDTTRIDRTLPTIKSLLDRGAKLAIASHLGRPERADVKFSLAPVARYLANILDKKVRFSSTIHGDSAKLAVNSLAAGECLLFENLRFFPEETKNDPEFSKKIASNFDLYVNDAFGASHRKHASTYGVAECFKDAAAGYLLHKELSYLGQAVTNPKRPFIVILGGAKVRDKIKVVFNLISKTDIILIGGGMAYSFLHVQGKEIGKSILDRDSLKIIEKTLKFAEAEHKKIMLPVDHKVASNINANIDEVKVVKDIPADLIAFDIGPLTTEAYSNEIANASQVLWNGPMGVFEKPVFSLGTLSIAKAMQDCRGTTIVGGGDSILAINQAKVGASLSHISTGGGASLEFLEGRNLPGVEVLTDKR
ncbi:MAG: phosphoglycerate kinase [SAR324 cluster bacterium]|nr:phosphoglycerate kinase [SAR324 cluster bacterium]